MAAIKSYSVVVVKDDPMSSLIAGASACLVKDSTMAGMLHPPMRNPVLETSGGGLMFCHLRQWQIGMRPDSVSPMRGRASRRHPAAVKIAYAI
jgi:hypothetical protein